jgi:hypothetical protein
MLALFNHLIRPRQHIRRNRQPDLLRRFQIDDELKLRRLLDREIGRLCVVQNLVNISGSAPPVPSLVLLLADKLAFVLVNIFPAEYLFGGRFGCSPLRARLGVFLLAMWRQPRLSTRSIRSLSSSNHDPRHAITAAQTVAVDRLERYVATRFAQHD